MTQVLYTEQLSKQLEEFTKQEKKVITNELMLIIENIAKTGVTCYQWIHLKELIYFKLQEIFDVFQDSMVIDSTNNSTTTTSSSPTSSSSSSISNNNNNNNNSNKNDDTNNNNKNQLIRNQIQNHFKDYKEPPFTIQRLCELIVDYKIYTSFSKYLCAVERVGNVTSTLPPLSPAEVVEYNASLLRSSPIEQHKFDHTKNRLFTNNNSSSFSVTSVFPSSNNNNESSSTSTSSTSSSSTTNTDPNSTKKQEDEPIDQEMSDL